VIARRSNFSVFEWFSLQICCGSCWLGCCSDRIVVNLCLALLTVTLLHISPLTSYLQCWKDEILPYWEQPTFQGAIENSEAQTLTPRDPISWSQPGVVGKATASTSCNGRLRSAHCCHVLPVLGNSADVSSSWTFVPLKRLKMGHIIWPCHGMW
jgi:hypothetical protein